MSFCTARNDDNPKPYSEKMLPFTSPHKDNLKTHNDPDWCNMTYGDVCSGKGCIRGYELRYVIPGDIFLFWGLLWHNENTDWREFIGKKGACWEDFSRPLDSSKGWYLIGAIRIEKIIVSECTLDKLSPEKLSIVKQNVISENALDRLSSDERYRLKRNAHFHFADNRIRTNHWIFLGDKDKKCSQLLHKPVELWIPKTKQKNESNWKESLLYRTFRTDKGNHLSLNSSPLWHQYLRRCRRIWDLKNYEQLKLAKCVRDAIQKENKEFNLLENLYFERSH